MKRLSSSDSLGAMISICPTSDENSPRNNHLYSREFHSMLDGLDEEGCVEEAGHVSEKKRRLSLEQVKALEKNFEVENKLEPERKVKLAQELGLQPRQVAVWFQNRRARWKTKQLERDYGVLKANYDSLKLNFDTLQHDNEALHKEIKQLKAKLREENTESNNPSVKEEQPVSKDESNYRVFVHEQGKSPPPPPPESSVPETESNKDVNFEPFNNTSLAMEGVEAVSFFPDFKDGSSDSDSSAILNEDNSPIFHDRQLMKSPASTTLKFNCSSSSSPSSSSMNCFQFQKSYQPQFVKIEEHNFFSSEEACSFFSDEQAPTLQQWYSSEQWN